MVKGIDVDGDEMRFVLGLREGIFEIFFLSLVPSQGIIWVVSREKKEVFLSSTFSPPLHFILIIVLSALFPVHRQTNRE